MLRSGLATAAWLFRYQGTQCLSNYGMKILARREQQSRVWFYSVCWRAASTRVCDEY